MAIPHRLKRQAGRYSLVDGIPFQLPIYCKNSPCLMAAFSINAEKARALLPGNEIYPLRLWNKGVLVITVIDYRDTVIGMLTLKTTCRERIQRDSRSNRRL